MCVCSHFLSLTALNLQGAVLFIEGVPSQVHHAGCCSGYSGKRIARKKKKKKNRERRVEKKKSRERMRDTVTLVTFRKS